MGIEQVYQAFRAIPPPKVIRGDSYGIDATEEQIVHLIQRREEALCAEDFFGYLGEPTTGGAEDFIALLPGLLSVWKHEIDSASTVAEREGTNYWFVPSFHDELRQYAVLIDGVLPESIEESVLSFIREALLEHSTENSGFPITTVYRLPCWIGRLLTYGIYAPDFSSLWEALWAPSPRNAEAVLHLTSLLAYELVDNPVYQCFDTAEDVPRDDSFPWYFESNDARGCWTQSNVNFLNGTLTAEYLALNRNWVCSNFDDKEQVEIVNAVWNQVNANTEEVANRCASLIKRLGTPGAIPIA